MRSAAVLFKQAALRCRLRFSSSPRQRPQRLPGLVVVLLLLITPLPGSLLATELATSVNGPATAPAGGKVGGKAGGPSVGQPTEAASSASHTQMPGHLPPPPEGDPPQASVDSVQAEALPRSTADRPDDITGAQIHLMYVLPSDGVDRGLDTDGNVATSALSVNKWLMGATPGRELRLDTFEGSVDVTFFRLARTDAEVRSGAEFGGPAFVRDIIEKDMIAAGFDKSDTIYAVYYDGSSDFACGGAAWPPVLPGTVGALYLQGLAETSNPCADQGLPGTNIDDPGYFDFSMLHEVLHVMGFVATCAPNEQAAGHVPEPTDIMYGGGTESWDLSSPVLDIDQDDYYQHSNAGCPDFDDSPYLTGSSDGGDGTLTVDDVDLTEGDSGTSTADFTVSLSAASTEPVSVDYATVDGSAEAPGDYSTAAGSLTFAPGETTKTVTVTINGDLDFEPDEDFFVNLTAANGATIGEGGGRGTIRNDDPEPDDGDGKDKNETKDGNDNKKGDEQDERSCMSADKGGLNEKDCRNKKQEKANPGKKASAKSAQQSFSPAPMTTAEPEQAESTYDVDSATGSDISTVPPPDTTAEHLAEQLLADAEASANAE